MRGRGVLTFPCLLRILCPQRTKQRWEDPMPISRQTLLKSSAAATAALSLDWTRAQAQAETVRIGVIYDLTGPFAAGGSVACSVGTQIAIDLVNEKGGIGGKYKNLP